MASKFRRIPPVCLVVSIIKLLIGKLRLPRQFVGTRVKMQDGQKFTIFRHVTIYPLIEQKPSIVFIVRFKFARLSHKLNKLASIIPMLLITGFQGFEVKMYAVNTENGYWQGMYQWKTKEHLDAYKKSFVYRIMNKRAIDETVSSFEMENHCLLDYITNNMFAE